jgi:hypothetical protein
MMGGFGSDDLTGTFSEDIIMGEYGRVTFNDSQVTFVVRPAGGVLDLGGSAQVGLYQRATDKPAFADLGLITSASGFTAAAAAKVFGPNFLAHHDHSHSSDRQVDSGGHLIIGYGSLGPGADLVEPPVGDSGETGPRLDDGAPEERRPATAFDGQVIEVIPDQNQPDGLPTQKGDQEPTTDHEQKAAGDLEMMAAALGGWTVVKPGSGKKKSLLNEKSFRDMQLLEKARRFGRWNGSRIEGRDL